MVNGGGASADTHEPGLGLHRVASEKHAFRLETEEELQASKERKLKLLAEIEKHNREHPPLWPITQEEVDALMREVRYERDHRHDDLVFGSSGQG